MWPQTELPIASWDQLQLPRKTLLRASSSGMSFGSLRDDLRMLMHECCGSLSSQKYPWSRTVKQAGEKILWKSPDHRHAWSWERKSRSMRRQPVHSPIYCPLQKPCSVSSSAILVSPPRIVSTMSCNPVTFLCKILQQQQQWSALGTPLQQPWADAVDPNPLFWSHIPSNFWAASYRTTWREGSGCSHPVPAGVPLGPWARASQGRGVNCKHHLPSPVPKLRLGWEIWAVQYVGAVQKQLPHWCCCTEETKSHPWQ